MRGCERGAGAAPARGGCGGCGGYRARRRGDTHHGEAALNTHSPEHAHHHTHCGNNAHTHRKAVLSRHNSDDRSKHTIRVHHEHILLTSVKTKRRPGTVNHSQNTKRDRKDREVNKRSERGRRGSGEVSDSEIETVKSVNAVNRRSEETVSRETGCRGEVTIRGSETGCRGEVTIRSSETGWRGEGERRDSELTPRTARGGALVLCALLLLSLRGSQGAGALGALGAGAVCARAPLTEKQRALCRAEPAAMAAIATGLRAAHAECRSQLAGRRWNCSGVGDGATLAHVMPRGTREAAFTYALTSAGVTHALSAACARGELPACGCGGRRRAEGEQWEWGGAGAGAGRCGETAFAARLARRFLDAREIERDARAAMNLHNNRLGRKLVRSLSRRECKCHGVSGSCALRTCWRALPALRSLGRALRDKYPRAKMVVPVESSASVDGRANIQLVVKRARGAGRGRLARKSELVFLAASPTYCEPEPAVGAPGTRGRSCDNTSTGEEGCGSLCCGRGYSTERRSERAQCRCRFHWCCRVSCESCLVTTERHFCN